jgi:hypothetical protein
VINLGTFKLTIPKRTGKKGNSQKIAGAKVAVNKGAIFKFGQVKFVTSEAFVGDC